MTCWACELAEKNRASGYYQAGCPACDVRHIARLPRHHRVAAYRAAQAAGRDVLELQTAVRKQYEIDKSKVAAK